MDTAMRARVVGIYRDAVELIRKHDYDPEGWVYAEGGRNPTGENMGLNVRQAITIAISNRHLTGRFPAYETHVAALQQLTKNYGGALAGITNWETQRRRTQAQVIDMFEHAINRLEAHEDSTGSGRRSNSPV